MRALIASGLLLIVSPLASLAQATALVSPCPPVDSLATASTPGRVRIGEGMGESRFVTIVIDSQFVIANVPRDLATGRFLDTSALGDLRVDDLEFIFLLKDAEAARWSACAGVPVVLLLTKRKLWRPPVRPPT